MFRLRRRLIKNPAVRALAGWIGHHRGIFALVCVTGFLGSLFEAAGLTLVIPLLQGETEGKSLLSSVPVLSAIGDDLGSLALADRIRLIAVLLISTAILRGVLIAANRVLANRLQTSICHDLRMELYDQTVNTEVQFVENRKISEISTMLTYTIPTIGAIILRVGVVSAAISVVLLYAALMLAVSVPLTLVSVVSLLLVAYPIKVLLNNRLQRTAEAANEQLESFSQRILESINSIRLIHLLGIQRGMSQKYRESSDAYRAVDLRRTSLQSLVEPTLATGVALAGGLILIGGTVIESTTASTLTAMIFMLIVLSRLMPPAAAVTDLRAFFAAQEYYVTVLADYLSKHEKPYIVSGSRPLTELGQRVSLESVTFQYDSAERPALHGVSMEVPVLSTVGLVGPSGSGKSTIVGLIARLFDPSAGRIAVDGEDLRAFRLRDWRSSVAVVTQETFLFNDTVLENIRLGRPRAARDQVEEAARLGHAHEFIAALPLGYDTVVGDRGVKLSGGQRQRLAIARALLMEPKFLILDEATSQLDSESESLIQAAIAGLTGRCTMLVVAHRLSTVRSADSIVVLDAGRVVEVGTHDELTVAGGLYARLSSLQGVYA
jgi:ATP-binding cassette, subfamily B, bacterial MsbA